MQIDRVDILVEEHAKAQESEFLIATRPRIHVRTIDNDGGRVMLATTQQRDSIGLQHRRRLWKRVHRKDGRVFLVVFEDRQRGS